MTDSLIVEILAGIFIALAVALATLIWKRLSQFESRLMRVEDDVGKIRKELTIDLERLQASYTLRFDSMEARIVKMEINLLEKIHGMHMLIIEGMPGNKQKRRR